MTKTKTDAAPRTILLALTALSFGQLGCSTDSTVSLGDTKGSALIDYAAEWDGHAEAYELDRMNTPTDRIRLTLAADGTGTMRIGDAAVIPPPTDFDLGYPVGARRSFDLYNGAVYPIHDARVEGSRLRFNLRPSDLFKDWCAHQTPSAASGPDDGVLCGGSFTHAPDMTCMVFDAQGQGQSVDCGKAELCENRTCICSTSAGTCRADESNTPYAFDATLEEGGTKLVGTLALDARVVVRFDRP